MRIAYIMLCHKNPEQINLLLNTLSNEKCDFYIHIDSKCDFELDKSNLERIYVIGKEKRVDVRWGHISMVYAIITLLEAVRESGKEYDYIWLISGQDFPIKPLEDIQRILSDNKGSNFLHLIDTDSADYKRFLKRNVLYYPKWFVYHNIISNLMRKMYLWVTGGNYHTFYGARKDFLHLKFYFGSTWWVITQECASYILDYIKQHEEILQYYKNTLNSDESFFHTIIMNSKYKETQRDYLTYIDWSDMGRSPKLLTLEDYETMINSQYVMARKFDMDVDRTIIDRLNSYIHSFKKNKLLKEES